MKVRLYLTDGYVHFSHDQPEELAADTDLMSWLKLAGPQDMISGQITFEIDVDVDWLNWDGQPVFRLKGGPQ